MTENNDKKIERISSLLNELEHFLASSNEISSSEIDNWKNDVIKQLDDKMLPRFSRLNFYQVQQAILSDDLPF